MYQFLGLSGVGGSPKKNFFIFLTSQGLVVRVHHDEWITYSKNRITKKVNKKSNFPHIQISTFQETRKIKHSHIKKA